MEKHKRIMDITVVLLLVAISLIIVLTFNESKEEIDNQDTSHSNEETDLLGFHYFLDNNNNRIPITLKEDYTCVYSDEDISCKWSYESKKAINVTTPYYSISEASSGGVLYHNLDWKTIEKCNEGLKKYMERYSVNAKCVEHFVTDRLIIEE